MAAVAEKAIGSSDGFAGHQASAEAEQEYRSDVRKLVDLLSKLNPAAEEFFPSSRTVGGGGGGDDRKSDLQPTINGPAFFMSDGLYGIGLNHSGGSSNDSSGDISSINKPITTRKTVHNQRWKRMSNRARRVDREDSVRRTVYVSDIDHHVTEEKLAEIFANCGHVVDCRICGDPHSVLRFAFIEFSDEDGARTALNLGGTVLGYYPLKVLPSKTAILPVNPKFLPSSNDEREMVIRTVYCTNIDKKVTQTEVKDFFEQFCGQVSRLRLLGDNIHSTRIAFVEFVQAESAIVALNCSGNILGALPIRVSPSKTPVRPRGQRSTSN